MNPNPNKIIIVLGMHRSGTSVLTRAFRVLGARMGDRFLDPREDNPKGFWEDHDLLNLNFEMFDCLGMEWNRLTPMTDDEVCKLVERGFLEKACALLVSKLKSGGTVALKHPGTAKIFPFWKKVFAQCGCEVDLLLAVRHPLSVAKSLERRDGIQKCYGSLMWLAHVIPSFSLPKGSRALVTDYDCFMSDPAKELTRIAKCFQLQVDPAEMKSYQNEFLDSNLRHSSYTLSDLEAESQLPSMVSEVYRGILDLASDRAALHDSKSVDLAARWVKEFEDLSPYLKLIETTTADRDRLTILLENAERELAWRNASLSWRLTRPLREISTWAAKVSASSRRERAA